MSETGGHVPGGDPAGARATIVLLTYNQEKFVAEAVRSALGQDYGPLEIVVSDDCSTDGTARISKEICESYSGPHRVILARNERNLGIVPNFLKAVSLSSGQWIVAAAGDDVSSPNRVGVLMRHAEADPAIRGLCSEYRLIDDEGSVIPDARSAVGRRGDIQDLPVEAAMAMLRSPDRDFFLLGATACWHRDLFVKFPPLTADPAISEDIILTWRAKMLGKTRILPDPLVAYRSHGTSLTNDRSSMSKDLARRRQVRNARRNRANAIQVMADVDYAARSGLLNEAQRSAMTDALVDYMHYQTARINWPRWGLSGRIRCLLSLWRPGKAGPRIRSLFQPRESD